MAFIFLVLIILVFLPSAPGIDTRNIVTGITVSNDTIFGEYYNCQDFAELFNESVWLATFSHARKEGGAGERAYTTFSKDHGKSWSQIAPIEESMKLASHGSQFIIDRTRNRAYVVYSYNIDNTTTYPDGKAIHGRTDMLGPGFFIKYSTDGGAMWSERILVTYRRTNIDRVNPWNGTVLLMNLNSQPQVIGSNVYIPFTKRRKCCGETNPAEPWILLSEDLLHVNNPSDAHWTLLPDGDNGLKPPGKTQLAEEPHLLRLQNDSSFLLTYRTDVGKIGAHYSYDGCHTFTSGEWLSYDPHSANRKFLKNPTVNLATFGLSNGLYVIIYYNNGRRTKHAGSRSLMWASVGHTNRSKVIWSQPEIILYDRNRTEQGPNDVGLFEQRNGEVLYIESQKNGWERLHFMNKTVLNAMANQMSAAFLPVGVLFSQNTTGMDTFHIPIFPDLSTGAAFTLAAWVGPFTSASHTTLLLHTFNTHSSFAISFNGSELSATLVYENKMVTWTSDDMCVSNLFDQKPHFLGVVVDGGPDVGSMVIDTQICDGGTTKPQGWIYFDPSMGVIGSTNMTSSDDVHHVWIWHRYLLNSELIAFNKLLHL